MKLQTRLIRATMTPGESLIGRWRRSAALRLVNLSVSLGIPFIGRTGFKIESVAPGYTRCSVPLRRNRNHIGTMYAGAMFTVAEVPGGVLTLCNFDERFFPLLKSLDMKFVRTASSPVSAEFHLSPEEIAAISSDADRDGKRDFVLEGELKDQQGNIVARSHGVYQIRVKKPRT